LLSIGWLATTSNGKRAIDAANRYDVKGATYAINGGYNGLNDRIKRTNELLANLS
jgi:predicted chitinase